jgi:hypothetical protein
MRTPRNEEEHATSEERCKTKYCANEFNHVCVLVFAQVFAQKNLFSLNDCVKKRNPPVGSIR